MNTSSLFISPPARSPLQQWDIELLQWNGGMQCVDVLHLPASVLLGLESMKPLRCHFGQRQKKMHQIITMGLKIAHKLSVRIYASSVCTACAWGHHPPPPPGAWYKSLKPSYI